MEKKRFTRITTPEALKRQNERKEKTDIATKIIEKFLFNTKEEDLFKQSLISGIYLLHVHLHSISINVIQLMRYAKKFMIIQQELRAKWKK